MYAIPANKQGTVVVPANCSKLATKDFNHQRYRRSQRHHPTTVSGAARTFSVEWPYPPQGRGREFNRYQARLVRSKPDSTMTARWHGHVRAERKAAWCIRNGVTWSWVNLLVADSKMVSRVPPWSRREKVRRLSGEATWPSISITRSCRLTTARPRRYSWPRC